MSMKRSRSNLPKNDAGAVLHGKPGGNLFQLRFADDPGLLKCSQKIDLSQQVDVWIAHDVSSRLS